MSNRLTAFLADFRQATFGSATTGITAAAISDSLSLHPPDHDYQSWVSRFPSKLRVHVLLTGTVSNTSVSLSIVMTDGNGHVSASPVQEQELRTLPDSSVVVGVFAFETLGASDIKIALETSTITGGGNVKIFYCFPED